MRLNVHRNGVKLFFITFAVAGRQKVLSQLAEGKPRPELLPLGEVVKAALLAIHKVWPAVGTSDFVIMPDHVHFLMVVDYLRDRGFNPLWATHRLLDAIEAAWDAREQAPEPPDMVEALRAAVVRGRQTAAALALGASPHSPGFGASPHPALGFGAAPCGSRPLAGFGASPRASHPAFGFGASPHASHLALGFGALPRSSHYPPPALFERSPWLDLAFDPRQLKAVRHYIRLNPARALWKARHPDLFACRRALSAARLNRLAPRRFDGIGNLALLGSPFLFHVRLTLKKTVEEHREAIDAILERARHGWVPVSGFISPGERELLRRLKDEPAARFIRLLPYALPDRYDPSAEDSREIAAGRLAIISPLAATRAPGSLAMRNDPAASRAFRAACLEMNDIAARLCEPLT